MTLGLSLAPALAVADSFFVEEIKGVEITAQDKHSVRELIRISVTQVGDKNSVTSQADGSDWMLSPNLLKLGDSYVLTIEKRKSKSGPIVFSESMKSTSMSNMDVTAKRLVQAVLEQKRFEETADVTNITEEETSRNTKRYEATRQWILGFGPGWAGHLNSPGGGFSFLLGYEWGLDPDYSVDLSYFTAGGKGSDNSRFTDFTLGGTYYLKRTKISPYATARFGYGGANMNSDCSISQTCYSENSATGWTGSLAGGVKFFRTSSVNLSIGLRYSLLFTALNGRNPSLTSLILAVHY